MTGTIPSTLHALSHLVLFAILKEGSMIIFILHIRKLEIQAVITKDLDLIQGNNCPMRQLDLNSNKCSTSVRVEEDILKRTHYI